VGRRKHKFNRIHQVAAMCPHGTAHWRNLANTFESSVRLRRRCRHVSTYFDHLLRFCTAILPIHLVYNRVAFDYPRRLFGHSVTIVRGDLMCFSEVVAKALLQCFFASLFGLKMLIHVLSVFRDLIPLMVTIPTTPPPKKSRIYGPQQF